MQHHACVIFRQSDIADGPEPAGGKGFATRDVPGDSGGPATNEGGGPLRPGGQDETVQATSEYFLNVNSSVILYVEFLIWVELTKIFNIAV